VSLRVNLKTVHVSAAGGHQMILSSMKRQPVHILAVARGGLGLGYDMIRENSIFKQPQ